MKISSVLLSALLVFTGETFASPTARTAQQERCGEGIVLSTETVLHNGTEITLTTKSCPALEAQFPAFNRTSRATTPVAEKRQYAQCSDYGCTVECANLGSQPFVADCQVITDYLESLYPEEFLAPALTISSWSTYSCEYGFINFDTSEYAVCYTNFGFNAIIAADDCFGDWPATTATSGAYCVSPGYVGADWAIQ
ncbi:hypothetical protein OF83DRAFT_1084536 [Amylostereum chailletii]|nr:hypothetical protein OF83DRAFT_1084536 [Amylostereum chailletii]